MVAADINRSQKIAGTKIPGQSNTAQDVAAAAQHDNSLSLLGSLTRMEAAGATASAAAKLAAENIPGASLAGKVIGGVWSGMRQIGAGTVNQLVDEAMLHPEIARTLMTRVTTPTPPNALQQKLARAMQASVADQLSQSK